MGEFIREMLYEIEDFTQYELFDEEGFFTAKYVARWPSRDGNIICCFDLDDGRKIKTKMWVEHGCFDLDKKPLGAKVYLEFRKSATGRNYLRNVTYLEGEIYDAQVY